MTLLSVKKRDDKKNVKQIRESGRIPAVIYGHKTENTLLDIDYKEFAGVLNEAGESSLVELNIEGEKEKRPVLIQEAQKDPVSDKFIHVDFFQPSLTEEVEVEVPVVIEGVSLAVKELGGTLVKNISEISVKALPQNLPQEIKVSIEALNTFDDHILVKDLVLPENVKVLLSPEEIVVSVAEPAKVEEDLAEEIKEDVEGVEKVEKEKKEGEVIEEGEPEKPTTTSEEKPKEEKK